MLSRAAARGTQTYITILKKNTYIMRRGPKLKVSRGVMLFVGSLAEDGPCVLQYGGKLNFSCSKIVDS